MKGCSVKDCLSRCKLALYHLALVPHFSLFAYGSRSTVQQHWSPNIAAMHQIKVWMLVEVALLNYSSALFSKALHDFSSSSNCFPSSDLTQSVWTRSFISHIHKISLNQGFHCVTISHRVTALWQYTRAWAWSAPTRFSLNTAACRSRKGMDPYWATYEVRKNLVKSDDLLRLYSNEQH